LGYSAFVHMVKMGVMFRGIDILLLCTFVLYVDLFCLRSLKKNVNCELSVKLGHSYGIPVAFSNLSDLKKLSFESVPSSLQ
jgi:hypothetical protein